MDQIRFSKLDFNEDDDDDYDSDDEEEEEKCANAVVGNGKGGDGFAGDFEQMD